MLLHLGEQNYGPTDERTDLPSLRSPLHVVLQSLPLFLYVVGDLLFYPRIPLNGNSGKVAHVALYLEFSFSGLSLVSKNKVYATIKH